MLRDITTFDHHFHRPDRIEDGQYVICGRSFLTNSIAPQFEIVYLCPRRVPGSDSRLYYDGSVTMVGGVGGWKRRLLNCFLGRVNLREDVPHLDLRPLHIRNWSHSLNQAIPLALMARDKVRNAGGGNLAVILPSRAPKKIVHLFRWLKFECVLTDRPATGCFVHFDPLRNGVIHHFARDWLKPHLSDIRLLAAVTEAEVPEKIFINRRNERRLLNSAEIEGALSKRGFITVYPEDLNLEHQLALLMRAREVVAIHGAGLAPLIFRTPEDGPLRFTEILSPGHVSLFFRSLIKKLPVDYRAVRGNPDRQMAQDAHRLLMSSPSFKKRHADAPFFLDLPALEIALQPERVQDIVAKHLKLEDVGIESENIDAAVGLEQSKIDYRQNRTESSTESVRMHGAQMDV